MPVRLKRLTLHGFKSFADPVTLTFEPGITAIVGPNGSGKSNLVEAIRWALGEQSPAQWRGRRSDDVIFAGGHGRAALGMAEVSLTLEQDDHSLGLPFSEVTITRRVFRDGEQHYLLNGSRVRLRDILQIAATLGVEHLVINQGQVDAVLHQRPAERRALIEHAAGLGGIRARQQEALRDLTEAEAHAARLDDLLRELEPHITALAHAARAAEEARTARRALHDCLEQLYAQRWREAVQLLQQQTSQLLSCEQALEAAQAQLTQATMAEQVARSVEQAAAQEAATAAQEAHTQRERVRQLHHEHQLVEARVQAIAARLADLERQQQALEQEAAAAQEERAQRAERIARLQAEQRALEAEVTAAERSLEAVTQERATQRAQLAQAQEKERALAREQAALEAQIEQRRQALQRASAEREQLLVRLAEHETALVSLRNQAATAQQAVEAATAQRHTAAAAYAAARQHLAQREAEHDAARHSLIEAEHTLATLRARLDALEHAREADVTRASQAVLKAARAGQLSGIYGTVSELLNVPPHYERAIETALGNRLFDLVVGQWTEAEAAIAYLKAHRIGRATFHPLDTIRPPAPSLSPLLLREAGVHGIAAHLVQSSPAVQPVVQLLLGRVLVVADLAAAHRLLALLPNGWTMVTLDGELVRSSGSITGGAARREHSILALERERRTLTAELRTAQQKVDTLKAKVQSALQGIDTAQRAVEQARHTLDAAETTLRQVQLAAERTHQAVQAREAARAQDLDRLHSLEQTIQQQENAQAAAMERLAAVAAALTEQSTIRQQLEAKLAANDDVQARSALAEARQKLAAVQSTLREIQAHDEHRRRQQERLRDRCTELARERHTTTEEYARLQQQREHLATALAKAIRAADRAHDQLTAAEARLAEARSHAQARAAERAAAEQAHAAARAAVERQRAAADRARDTMTHLLAQAALDLDASTTEPAEIEARLAARAATLPPDLDSQALETQARHLRARWQRLRHLESEAAIAQYQAEQARYNRLQRELADVRHAAQAIRDTLRVLDRQLTQAYRQTVRALDQAFRETFRELFGGGNARLIDEGGDTGGIELLAQPPGKKVRSLNALSGGERALTALALVIATLQVHPTPFCILDEVDAALDEANAGRVSGLFQRLAKQTQLVIVTHNRITIEAADILYGVTMGTDGASRILSLRLPSDQEANAAG